MRKTLKPKPDLLKAVQEMAAHRRGRLALSSRPLRVPEQVDVVSVRKDTGLTQREFAERYGFVLSTLKDWEQARRMPERSARILLSLIAIDRPTVDKAISKL